MIRRFKPFLFALAAITFLLCATELSLQFVEGWDGVPIGRQNKPGNHLLVSSWEYHHSLKPSAFARGRNADTHKSVEFHTNSLGLRGPEPTVDAGQVIRVLVLGDERILGAQLPYSRIVTSQLREILQNRSGLEFEVINGGCFGYCPLLSYLQLRHRLSSLRPDIVVVNFDMSDVADDHHYRRHVHLSGDDTPVPLICPHPELAHPTRNLTARRLLDRFALTRIAKNKLNRFASKGRAEMDDIDAPEGMYAWLRDNPPDWSMYVGLSLTQPVREMRRLAGPQALFVLSTCPAPWQVSAQAVHPKVRARYGVESNELMTKRFPFELLRKFAEREQMIFADASPDFQTSADGPALYLKQSPELSAAGHRLLAEVLSETILRHSDRFASRQQLVPPPRTVGRPPEVR